MSDFPIKFAEGFSEVSYADWQQSVETVLKGKSFNGAMQKQTFDGVSINALNSQDNAVISDQPVRNFEDWAVVSPHWGNDANSVNTDILEDLGRGASALAVTIDETGIHGIKSSQLANALENVYLDMVPLTLVQGSDFGPVITELNKILTDRGYQASDIHGLLGIDPIGALARYGYLNQSAEDALSAAVKVAKQYAQTWPRISTFVADGTVYSNAGAAEAQELAVCLSTAVTYLRAMEKSGMGLGVAARQIQFTMSASTNLWQTIAKFRAIRRLWAQILDASGVKGVTPRINAVSALYQFSMKDPWVNILRGTAACFGAAIGGADAVTVLPHDLMLGTVNKFSRKIARNVQIVLQEESNLSKVIDPSSGSYSIEALTQDMTQAAWAQFQELETAGGILAELRNGSFAKRIKASSDLRTSDIRKRKLAITGVSEFPDISEKSMAGMLQHPSENIPENNTGEHIQPLPLQRMAWEFEKLRFKSDDIEIASGKRPSIFLANIGSPADFTARATFAKNFFEAGGIKAISGSGAETTESLLEQATQSSADFAILCGTDNQYEQIGAQMMQTLKQAGFNRTYLAGRLQDKAAMVDSGMDDMIFMGCDVVAVLEEAYSALEDNTAIPGVAS